MLILVDIFSEEPETYLSHQHNKKKVVKTFFNHRIPRFKVLLRVSSNKKLHFVVTVIREINKVLRLTWDLHTPYRPQASGKIKYMKMNT
ncbi:hypothetical protein Nmel_014162 [Mimus melanotis]